MFSIVPTIVKEAAQKAVMKNQFKGKKPTSISKGWKTKKPASIVKKTSKRGNYGI